MTACQSLLCLWGCRFACAASSVSPLLYCPDILNNMVNDMPEQLTTVFFALADPTRRAILERLRHGEASGTELAQPFSISVPAISKHLRVLENAGLVRHRKN